MMKYSKIYLANGLTALAIIGLAACGGGSSNGGAGGSNTTQPAINGAVVKGPVLGATVCAFAISGGAKAKQLPITATPGSAGSANGNGCYVTAADGRYSFSLPANNRDEVILEATGGSFCSNEVAITNGSCINGGTVLALSGAPMHTVATLAAGTTTIYITPLSSAAYANAAGGALSVQSFNNQFQTLAGQVAGTGGDITAATLPTPANHAYLQLLADYLNSGGSLATALASLQQGSTRFSSNNGSAVALAEPFSFAANSNDDAIMREMAGEYDVAIISAPSATETGLGKVVVNYAGNNGAVGITLKDASGAILVTRTAPALSERNCATGRCVQYFDNKLTQAEGRRIGLYNYYDAGNTNTSTAYANLSFFLSGNLGGHVGNYAVRNGIYAFGSTIPAQFTSLAGTYIGTAQQLTCAPNPVMVEINAGGSIRITGKTSVSCVPQDVTVVWDGIDDFIAIEPSGQITLRLNNANIGGSQLGGGITLTLSDGNTPSSFTEARLTFSGADGDITTVNATAQGK